MNTRVGILCIGNELLNGSILDTNSQWISTQLRKLGIETALKITVNDRLDEITKAMQSFADFGATHLVTTGGLGPTRDDLTREAVSRFTGTELLFHEELFEEIKRRFSRAKIPFPEENKKQAYLPAGSVVIENKNGSAPGFEITDEKSRMCIASYPGVPSELKSMFRFQGNSKRESATLRLTGIPESVVEQLLKDISPEGIEIGTVCGLAGVDLRFDGIGATAFADEILKKIPRFQKMCFSRMEKVSLQQRVLFLLKEKGLKVAFAESCTGGLVSKMLTDIEGSSSVFDGSVVTYANEIKQSVLGVSAQTLEKFGAVSFETALEMRAGLEKIFDADYTVSVTGIAGTMKNQTGDTSEGGKPVGTVYIGLKGPKCAFVFHFRFRGDRIRIRERAAHTVFLMLFELRTLGEIDRESLYGWIEQKEL